MKGLSIKKQISEAPKYGLFIEGAGFLACKQNLTGVVFTDCKELAMQYAEGFDNVTDKLSIWNAAVKRMFNCDIKFEAIYL